MAKRTVLFVKDKGSLFGFKKGFLDKARYSLEVVSGLEAALRRIPEKNFDLVICGLEKVDAQATLLSEAKRKNSWVKTIFITNCPLEDSLSKIVQQNLSLNIVSGSPPLNLGELSITVEKLFSKNVFGINKYLPDEAKCIATRVNDSNEKLNCVNQIRDFVRAFNPDHRFLRGVSNIVDELLMNAFYSAPCNAQGEPLYGHLDRKERVVLKESEAINLRCAYDGRYLVISVSDAFGSVDRDKLLGSLIACSKKNGMEVAIAPGSNGVGIYKILEFLSSLVINLEPRKKTEVIAIIDLRWPRKKTLMRRFKSLHVFIQSDELRMADELTVAREDLDDVLLVALKGVIDENALFGRIFETDKKKIRVNLHGVTRINSCGIREWINAIRGIPAQKKLEFIECSLPMVKQFSMITNFAGHGRVTSFLAPYFCPRCNKQFEELLLLDEHFVQLVNLRAPTFVCPDCGGKLEFDELEEKYFQFILRQECKVAK